MDAKVSTDTLLRCIDYTSICSKKISQCLVLIKASYKLLDIEFESEQTDAFKDKTLELANVLSKSSETLGKCSKFLNELGRTIEQYGETRYQ